MFVHFLWDRKYFICATTFGKLVTFRKFWTILMFRYFIRRLLFAVPTLLVASLAFFTLSLYAPAGESLETGNTESNGGLRQQYKTLGIMAANIGLNKPPFYCTLTTAAQPDTLYRIFPLNRRARLSRLSAETGDGRAVMACEAVLLDCAEAALQLPDSLPGISAMRPALSDLLRAESVDSLHARFDFFEKTAAETGVLKAETAALRTSLTMLRDRASPLRQWLPALRWHGADNRYHRWLSGFVTGDLGISLFAQKPVWEALFLAMSTTLSLNAVAFLLAYLLAVPLGVAMARRKGSAFDRRAHFGLLFLYAMPGFWVGSLLILFFATPDSGLYLIRGVRVEAFAGSGQSYLEWWLSNSAKFILPIATLTVHILAVLALQMRGGMLETLGQDYIRTARAKGLSENTVYWRHAFRNALFPLITVSAGILPALLAGSMVIEYLFNLPGMGVQTRNAFYYGDYPVLFAILMLTAALTILGNLIADLLYAWADPRITYSK
jgi:peptide/nickel transport system permease protein